MKVELISIGDELLIGQTVNTNATYLSSHLTAIGLQVKWVTTVGDDAADLTDALSRAMQRSECVITTGGLGPTHDDITKTVVAKYFDSELVFEEQIFERLKAAFAARNIPMAESNREQAYVPDKAEIIANPVGTAPGLLFEQDGKKCIVLPGVPAELRAMCEETVFPLLKHAGSTILLKTIRTTGIPESTLFERLGDIAEIEKYAKVAFLPKATGVDIRLTVQGDNPDQCAENVDRAAAMVRAKAGPYIYGVDDERLEEFVAKLLTEQRLTIAVAESCTGGMLAHRLTNVPGSSDYFERGFVTYSNQAKIDNLGVSPSTLEQYGAVSAETAVEMARGARKVSGTDIAIATTGIAGPSGGTPEKPVGLVYIALAFRGDTVSKRFVFGKDRLMNKDRTVQAALNMLRRELLKPDERQAG